VFYFVCFIFIVHAAFVRIKLIMMIGLGLAFGLGLSIFGRAEIGVTESAKCPRRYFSGGGWGIAGRRPVRCDRCALHCSRQPVARFGRLRGSLITCRLYDVRRFYRKNVLHDAPVSPNKTDRCIYVIRDSAVRRRATPHAAIWRSVEMHWD